MLIGIGVMNLITAIYIEHTLNQAKEQENKNKLSRNKESVRIARQMKALLTRFCAHQKSLEKRGDSVFDNMNAGFAKKDGLKLSLLDYKDLQVEEKKPLTREIFMLAIQDPFVQ